MPRNKRVRSRLAKLESQRMMRQSILMFVATILIILALVVWGVPAFVKVAGFLGDVRSSNSPLEQDDAIAPYAPQLNIPFEATSSARISISGFAEPGTQVVLFKNGSELDSQIAPEDGAFTFTGVNLDQGTNDLAARSVDGAGNESSLSRSIQIAVDSEAPDISIDSPDDGASYFSAAQKVIEITGTTEAGVDVSVNGRFTRVDEEGSYSQKLTLDSGDNTITAIATDRAGNSSEASITVKYTD